MVTFNYSLSKSIDLTSATESNFANGSYGVILNSYGRSLNRGVSDFDIRHQVNGYAVIALKHDIDPPPGLVGRFLNVAREVSGARSSSDQLGSAVADPVERAVLCATCRRVRMKTRSVRMKRSSMWGTMRSTVTGLLFPDPTASA